MGMDTSLNSLTACEHLRLSTNSIDKMISLPGLRNLKILSIGRNVIKKIAGLEEVGQTLEELWLSYNLISTLDGLHSCLKLNKLFIANNKIANWDELDKLTSCSELINVRFQGNPIYTDLTKGQIKTNVTDRLPTIKTLDG